MRKNHSTLTNDAVVKDLQWKFYQHSYLCAAWSWPRCYVCVCMLYVYSLCIFVSLRVTAREWPILVSKGHSVHPPDATFPVEAMHSCLLPQISIPSDPMEQRDRITLRTCACTHTHTRASMQADQEVTRFQGHKTEAWMEKCILSHVASFRSRSL